MKPHATTGPVHIIGSGLLGASVGLALRALEVEVTLEDISPAALAVAQQVGAGRHQSNPNPTMVVVAVPPDVTALVVAQSLKTYPKAVVTDLASVKYGIGQQLANSGLDLSNYVGSHPMAGKEQTGPAAAAADLFTGRPWVITAASQANQPAVLAVRDLATDLGASVLYMDPMAHDQAVALVSHLPQVVASLVAARLAPAPAGALDLAGQGLRDVTRIAASNPNLWSAILAANGPSVAELLRSLAVDLERAIEALELARQPEHLGQALVMLTDLIASGNQGASRIPGKHGGAQRAFDQVDVLVPDRVGALARLFALLEEAQVNLEDLRLEHAAGQAVGRATLSVPEGKGAGLASALEGHGWSVL
ncbi:MAG: prephenate dehydrogenase [Micrococcales bacterium]|nr:prephenate dehydrogenase [Micrococcales bacterium]